MKSQKRSFAAKRREAYRRTIRAYCPRITYKGSLVPPCYNCERIKGGLDCKGNTVGTRELLVAQAVASVLELMSYPASSGEIPKATFHDKSNTVPSVTNERKKNE